MDINIDLRDCIKFDNTYHFKLIRDGKIIQEETTHNIVCKGYFESEQLQLMKSLFLGSGKGIPSYDNTGLFNRIWGQTDFTPKSQSFDSNVSDDGKEAYAANTLKYVIPASSKYSFTSAAFEQTVAIQSSKNSSAASGVSAIFSEKSCP